MSGSYISSRKEQRPLTVKELREFFNSLDEKYDEDYLTIDGDKRPWDKCLTFIQVMGLRFGDEPQPLTTCWMTNEPR